MQMGYFRRKKAWLSVCIVCAGCARDVTRDTIHSDPPRDSPPATAPSAPAIIVERPDYRIRVGDTVELTFRTVGDPEAAVQVFSLEPGDTVIVRFADEER